MVLCPGFLLTLKLAVWLINVTTKALEKFVDDSKDPPPYAILSHTWGADDEEISFQELQGSEKKRGLGQYKFDQCCSQAIRDGLSYAWIDTCCIDKTNSTELGEAINSMFKWYKNAQVCYAYLCDVGIGEDPQKPESSFWKSRWFQRGWTLQELIAPAAVTFYDTKWNNLGTKYSLRSPLSHITRVPEIYLLGIFPLHHASVAQRMSWAAGRVTKRKEDLAYCLLGIFGIAMSMIYGEGTEAFIRLQKKIASRISDDSILAWNFGNYSSTNKPSKVLSVGALASSPSSFANSSHITPIDPRRSAFGSLRTRGTVLSVRRRLHTNPSGQCFVILQCQQEGQQQGAVGIPVEARPGGDHNYIRLSGQPAILLPEDVSQTDSEDIRILVSHSEAYSTEPRYSFYIENTIGKDLKLTEVAPHRNWRQGQNSFFINDDAGHGRLKRIWTMFRYKQDMSGDFIIVLDFILRKSEPQVLHHVMTCDRGVELDEIRNNFAIFDRCDISKHTASIGTLSLEATVLRGGFGKKDMFVVRLLRVERASDTYNVTKALHHFKREQELVASWKHYHQADVEDESLNALIQEKQKEADLTQKQLAKLQEEIVTLQKGQRQLWQVENMAPLDYEPNTLRHMLLKQAQTLQTQFDQRYTDIDVAEETFEDWNEAAAEEMVGRLPSEERESFELVSEPAHRFLLAAARLGFESPFRQLAKRRIDVNITHRDGVNLLYMAAKGGNKRIVQALLILGADTRGAGENASSALHGAIDGGNADITRLLLDYGSEVDEKRPDGWTPFMLAVSSGYTSIVQILLEYGAKIDEISPDRRTALWTAASHGYESIVRILVENGASIEEKNPKGWTPLFAAAHNGHKAIVRVLVENGASIEEKTLGGWTPLFTAARNGREAIVRVLVENGASIEEKNPNGQTPLLMAAENGHEAIVRVLVENGASIKEKNLDGWTPLFAAAHNGHKAIVRILVENGASIKEKTLDGWTPLFTAARNGHEAIVRILVENGASIKEKTLDGWTPLLIAANKGHEAIVRVLVKNGASIEERNPDGWTPLLTAAGNGHEAVVKALVKKGAFIQERNPGGWTPLLIAAGNGHEAVVKALVEKGAFIEERNPDGWTPLSIAARNGHEAVVKALVEHGAKMDEKGSKGRAAFMNAVKEGQQGVIKQLLKPWGKQKGS